MKHLALRRVAALILLAAACHAPASFAQAAPAGRDKAAPPAAVVDAELLLRSCAGDAHRNAKLYVARAHGIELMKRSADRNQARSMMRIESQLDGMLAQLRGRGAVDADLTRMEDALVGLTELTLQQPVVEQIDAALRLATHAADACARMVTGLRYDAAATLADERARHLSSMLAASQQLAGVHLAALLRKGGASATDAAASARLAQSFEAQLTPLRKAADADAQLASSLALVDGQWLFMRQALSLPRENARTKLEDMGRASELLFEVIEGELRRQRRRG